jgi:phage replication O-like protein O
MAAINKYGSAGQSVSRIGYGSLWSRTHTPIIRAASLVVGFFIGNAARGSMANPQAENGHIDLANEIVESLAKYRLSGEEWQCLLVVFRKTYGWNKKEDEISLSQFQEMTGVKRANVVRTLKKLVAKKILGSSKEDTRFATKYWFNKDFDTWADVVKKDTTSINKDTPLVSIKIIPPVSIELPTIDNSTKDTITKDKKNKVEKVFVLPEWVPPEPWKGYLEMRNKIKKPMTHMAMDLAIKSLETLKGQGHDAEAVINQSILNSWQGLFAVKGAGNGQGNSGRAKEVGRKTGFTEANGPDADWLGTGS